MKKRGHKIYATGSISSLISGLLGIICTGYPLLAGYLGRLGLFNLFFILPTAGFIFGIFAVARYAKARRYSKRQSLASGIGFARIGLVCGIVSILVGGLTVSGYVYLVIEKKAPPNKPVGQAEVFYYGDDKHNEMAGSTILLPDNNLLTIGFRKSYTQQSDSKIWDAILLKTDLNGEQLWYKIIEDASKGTVVVNSEGEILLSIRSKRFIEPHSKYPLYAIIKFNLKGDSLDAKLYDFGAEFSSPKIMQLSDGNNMVFGKLSDETGERYNEILMKVDRNGDSLWTRRFSVDRKSMEKIFVETGEGGFVLAGSDPVEESRSELFRIFKTDSQGNLLWKNRNGDEIDFSPLQIMEMADGSLLLAGNRYLEGTVDGRILKLDAEGRLIWDKSIGNGSYTLITGMIPWTEGNYLAVGNVPKTNMYDFTNFGRIESWTTYYLATVSPDGKLVHSFHGAYEVFEPWGITLIDDGYCVITGFGGRGGDDENRDIGLLYYRADD